MATDVTFVANIDLSNNELRNAKAQILAADPAGIEGKFIYNSTEKQLKFYNGTAWVSGGAQVANLTGQAATFGQAAVNGASTTAARSDHYHAFPAHDGNAHSAVPLNSLAVPSGPVSMNSQKITGLAAGAVNGDAVRYEQLAAKADIAQTFYIGTTQIAINRASGNLALTGISGLTMAGTIAMGSNRITGLADGVAASDAATVGQVQAATAGLEIKQSARAATTANITLSGTQTIDGVAVAAGDRVLVKNQSTGSQNGIYVVAAGAWTRASDFDTSAEASPNSFCFVEEGTTQADTGWVLTTNAPITLGTTALTFVQFSGAGAFTAGNGLTQSGTTINVGAGNGILANADDVAVDPAVVVRKYATDLSTSATSYVITHNLNTRDVQVAVRQINSPYGAVFASWEATTVDTVTVYFATAPTANTYRVVVQG